MEASKLPKPNFFIVGAPKCGTTALYGYLKLHPEIYMCDVKEPVFFGSKRFKDISDYLALFSGANHEKMIGEASPNYLFSDMAAQQIKAFDPSAKIIIMLRSPVDLLYSAYFQSRASGTENINSFEEAINIGDERKNGNKLSDGVPARPIYRNYVRFTEGVTRYFTLFGRVNVHVIIYDDFQKDTAAVYRQTLEFLNVNPDFKPEFQVVNASKEVRSPKLQKILLFFRLSPRQIKRSKVVAFIPSPLRSRLQTLFRTIYLVEKRPPPMDKQLKLRLQQEFLPEVQQLSELLERDLTHWCRD
jgi:Sulfotransferase domain